MPYDHHHFHVARDGRQRSPNGGNVNEGFRDTNEITLNADVYSRSAERRYNNGTSANSAAIPKSRTNEHDWQHLNRNKY